MRGTPIKSDLSDTADRQFDTMVACGTPIKSDLSDMSDLSDQVPHPTLMQNQSVYQY